MPCWRRLAASFSSRFDSCKSPNAHVAEIANVVVNPQIAIWNKLHIVHAYFVRFSKPCPCFQSLEISVTMGALSFVEMPAVALHAYGSWTGTWCQSKLRFWRGSSIWRWTPHCQSQFEACLTCLCFPRMCTWKLTMLRTLYNPNSNTGAAKDMWHSKRVYPSQIAGAWHGAASLATSQRLRLETISRNTRSSRSIELPGSHHQKSLPAISVSFWRQLVCQIWFYPCLQQLQLSEKSAVSRRLVSSFLVLILNLVLPAEAHRSHVDLKVKSEAKSWLFSHECRQKKQLHDFMPFHIFILLVHLEAWCHELPNFFAMFLLWGLRKQDKNLISFAEAGPKTIMKYFQRNSDDFPKKDEQSIQKDPSAGAIGFVSQQTYAMPGQFAPKVYSGSTRLEVSKLAICVSMYNLPPIPENLHFIYSNRCGLGSTWTGSVTPTTASKAPTL